MRGKRTPKIGELVVNAIRRLQDVQGSTARDISKYITEEYDVPSKDVKKHVQLALQRGVSYGILRRNKSGCYTCSRRDFLSNQPMDEDMMERCRPHRRRLKSRSRKRRRRRSRCSGMRRKRVRRCTRVRAYRRCTRSMSKRRVSGRSACRRRRRTRRRRRRPRRSYRKRRCQPCAMEMDAARSEGSPPRGSQENDELERKGSQSDGSSISGSSHEKNGPIGMQECQLPTMPSGRCDE